MESPLPTDVGQRQVGLKRDTLGSSPCPYLWTGLWEEAGKPTEGTGTQTPPRKDKEISNPVVPTKCVTLGYNNDNMRKS